MPLIAVLYVVFAAGLLLGFGGATFWGLALSVVCLCVAAWKRAWHGALISVLGAGAIIWGAASSRTERSCLTLIAQRREWLVDLVGEPAGNWWRGRWIQSACRTPVSVQVTKGSARAGSRVQVRGDYFRQRDRVQLRESTVHEVAAPSLLERARTRSGRTIDRLYPTHRALVRALLIADQRDIERSVRDAFADSGLVHMLSVSGLHVAIIFGAIQLLFAVARVSPRGVAVGALALTAAYVAMIGAPAPAVRASVMLGAGAATRIMQRPTSAWAIVALGGLVPLIRPDTVRDLGYQLSMAGIVGLVAAGYAAQRVLPLGLTGWRRALAGNALTTTLACVATLPIAAFAFGRTSMIAPVSNLVMSPLVTVLQPALFLSLAIAPFEPLARLVADGASLLLDLFSLGAATFAAVPRASLEIGFTTLGGLALVVTCVSLLVAAGQRYPGRALVTALGAASVVVWHAMIPYDRPVELHMIDVGQGDALALRASDGSWVLFDAGDSWRNGDAGERFVIPYLKRRGGRVQAIVLSHAHDDHVGGAATVLKRLRPAALIDGGYVTSSTSYRAALAAAQRYNVTWVRARPGDSLLVAGAVVRILAPDSAWADALGDPNEASVVARIETAGWRVLMTGDAEAGEEEWLMRTYATELAADILKVAHHGSATSTSEALLSAIAPRVALVSVGEGNTYRHPSSDVIRSLERRAQVYRTDRDGNVVIRFESDRLTAEANGERWRFLRGSGTH